jgi:hypothetical protein
MIEISTQLLGPGWIEMVFKGIAAGFLIAAMVWLLPGAEGAQFHVITLMTYLITAAGFMQNRPDRFLRSCFAFLLEFAHGSHPLTSWSLDCSPAGTTGAAPRLRLRSRDGKSLAMSDRALERELSHAQKSIEITHIGERLRLIERLLGRGISHLCLLTSRLAFWNLLALFSCLREADGDRLLATLDLAAFAALAALESTVLALAHGASHVFRCAARIFASHEVLVDWLLRSTPAVGFHFRRFFGYVASGPGKLEKRVFRPGPLRCTPLRSRSNIRRARTGSQTAIP